MDDIYAEIEAERARQDEQWGGPDHDDTHLGYDWGELVIRQAKRAHGELVYPYTMRGTAYLSWRQRMIQVAAVAVAAVEWFDRRVPPETYLTPPTPPTGADDAAGEQR